MSAGKKRAYVILAALNAVSAALFAVFALLLNSAVHSLPSQLAADRWKGGGNERYGQISVFFSENCNTGTDIIYTMRTDINKKITEHSLESSSGNGRTWLDAYSGQMQINVTSSRQDYVTNADAMATMTGGDYFMFHPVKLLSGCYYSPDDLMQDRVVLDEDLAWQLFGSADVDGMTVLIGEKRFYIAGVAESERNKAVKYAYGEKPRIYMSISGYELITGAAPPVTAYEALLPDPVSGIAEKIVTETVSAREGMFRVVDNTGRFKLRSLWKIAFDGGKRAVVDTPVVYPFWENAARITEEKAAALLVWAAAMLILPLATVLFFIFLLYRRRKIIINKAAGGIKSAAEKTAALIRRKKEPKERASET